MKPARDSVPVPRTASGVRRSASDDGGLDLEATIALLPSSATTKGLFFANVLDRTRGRVEAAELAREAGIEHRRYVAFFDYPYADILRLMTAGAVVMYPTLAPGAAVRKLASTTYEALLGSHVGRVLFAALGIDVEAILLTGPRAYSLACNFGDVRATRVGERRVRYEFRDFPALISTQQLGVVEGAIAYYGHTPKVEVEQRSLADATFDVTWELRR
jgi:uncharacterized protein (TIGR02265 family)